MAINKHCVDDGDIVYRQACTLGCEGIVSKRLGSLYRSGRSKQWVKVRNPAAVWREAEEEWRIAAYHKTGQPGAYARLPRCNRRQISAQCHGF